MKFIVSLLLISIIFVNATAQNPPVTTTYRVSFAFGSIGTGTPSDKPLLDFLSCFKTCNKLKTLTAVRIGPLGREGEYKLAFPLTELNKTKKKSFIAELKKLAENMNEHGYVTVTENDIINMNALGRATAIKQIL